jgi:hypothetical protein
VLKKLEGMKPIALEAANRWTDNAFMVRQWMTKMADADSISKFFKQSDIDLDSYEYLTEEAVIKKLKGGGKGSKSGGGASKSGGGKKRKAAAEEGEE